MLNKKDFFIIFCLFLFDQFTKKLAVSYLSFFNPIHLIDSILSFELVFNYGAAYGIFQHQRMFLLAVACLFIIGLIVFSSYFVKSVYSKFGVIFILAGAFGNMIDRLVNGYVIDFIDIKIFPVFNFADIFINISVILFLYEAFIYDRQHKSK